MKELLASYLVPNTPRVCQAFPAPRSRRVLKMTRAVKARHPSRSS